MCQRVAFVSDGATPPTDLDGTFDVLTVSDDRNVLECVAANAVDCVVVDETASEAMETIRAVRATASGLPIIYATARPDGAAGAAATRAGATEYYAGATEQTLADRVAAVTKTGPTETGTAAPTDSIGDASDSATRPAVRTTDAADPATESADPAAESAGDSACETSTDRRTAILERVREIIADDSQGFEARLEELLSFGRSALDVEYATLSRIEGDRYEFAHVAGVDDAIAAGQSIPLSDAYCERIAAEGSLLAFDSIDDRPDLRDRAAFHDLGVRCFLGAPVTVDGELWGSLCFFARDDRETGFSAWERTVVELVADWAGHELEHRHRRRELEQTRRSLEQTLERIDDAFFALDRSWEITYLNDRAADLIAPDGDDLVGRNVWDAFPEAVGMAFEEQYRHAMTQQEPVAFEEYFPPLETWFKVRASPSETGLSVYFTDVTERKRREAELREYETIVETIDDGVLVIDDDQRFARVNDAYADLVGVDREELLGTHASTFIDEETWVEWMDVAMSLTAGDADHATLEADLRRPDGETVPVEANVSSLPAAEADGDGFVCIVRDVTERTRREAVVTQLLETTRRLFSCESREAVAETIVDATTTTFGYPLVGVRLYDDDSERLHLEAASDCVATDLGHRESVPVGRGPIGEAFERSEPVLLTDIQDTDEYEFVHEYDPDDLRGVMCIPIGSVGVLSIGSPDAAAFDESDRQLAQLLTASAAVALERAERRETLLRHEQVLESVEGMVYAIDAEGRFTLVTEPLAERAGYEREALLGAHVSTVLDEASVADGQRRIEELLTGPDRDSTTFEATATTADGERFPVEIECSLLPDDGRFRGTVGAVRDITERKEREQYLQVLNRVLRHNLRNDLTVVIGYAELLLEAVDDEGLAAATETLHETATDLVRTSEKARAIQYALDRDGEPEPVDVAAITETAVADIDTDGATVRVSAAGDCWAMADGALSLVVENLLENAMRHAGREPTVEVSVTVDGEDVLVAVADDGPGIPAAEIEVVTGDSDITQLTHSSGLGLWLVRWIVDAYGGSISFEDGPLGGSEVTVALPRVGPPALEDER